MGLATLLPSAARFARSPRRETHVYRVYFPMNGHWAIMGTYLGMAPRVPTTVVQVGPLEAHRGWNRVREFKFRLN